MWDQKQRECWERAQAAIQQADATLERAERRQAEREERGEVPWRTDPGHRAESDPVPPLRRSAHTPRDWGAEQKWIEAIVNRRLSGFTEQIGQAIAIICAEEEREKWGPQIAELRAEVAKLHGADENRRFADALTRIGVLLERLAKIDGSLKLNTFDALEILPN